MRKNLKIGFLGAGNMAEALMKGLIRSKQLMTSNIIASDINLKRLKYISSSLKVKTTDTNMDVVRYARILFISVKPNVVPIVLEEIGNQIKPNQLLISIVAGVTTKEIEKYLSKKVPLVRVMPNTPALVLSGISALAGGSSANQNHMQLAQRLLSSVGKVVVLSESLLDTVTGLSGSGPAYVFQFIEALADGGVKEGLPRDIALLLAAQTVYGSAKMLLETAEHPASLRDKVTSPGGTTIAGLHVLENGKFRGTIMNAVSAASIRSRELSSGKK